MRELTFTEIHCVTGGTGLCAEEKTTGTDTRDNFLGGANETSPGSDLTSVYVVLVDATSRLIERVANALGD